MGYPDPVPSPPKFSPRLSSELIGLELREIAPFTRTLDVPAEEAERYIQSCYRAADILLDASERLKKHLKLKKPKKSIWKLYLEDFLQNWRMAWENIACPVLCVIILFTGLGTILPLLFRSFFYYLYLLGF
jgi:hypothetical protein